jgi:putative phosphoesterase
VKLGIVADAHGNVEAFARALDELTGEVDALLVAGDAFSDHRFSSDIVRMIRETEALYVLGNHELTFLGPGGARARESPRVSARELAFVQAAPTELRRTIGGVRLLMVHGSPFPPYARYLDPDSPEFERAGELDADLVVLGHTHLPVARRVGSTLIVNPGSVGMSDQPARGDQVGYAVVDTSSGEVNLVSFDNPRRAPR